VAKCHLNLEPYELALADFRSALQSQMETGSALARDLMQVAE
jgi:hypothetical protein